MSIKIEGGENRKFSTGATKQHSEGKGTPVLFPGDGYLEVCKHFEAGAKVHEPRNWEKGIPLSEIINSLERHIAQEKMGLTDERHDRAIAWEAIVYLTTKLRIQRGLLPIELDDMPRYGQQEITSKGEVVQITPEQEFQRKLTTEMIAMKRDAIITNGYIIEYIASVDGWQIKLADREYLAYFGDKYVLIPSPYYYETKQEAKKYLADYLETQK